MRSREKVARGLADRGFLALMKLLRSSVKGKRTTIN
jgi:hypothetical protein